MPLIGFFQSTKAENLEQVPALTLAGLLQSNFPEMLGDLTTHPRAGLVGVATASTEHSHVTWHKRASGSLRGHLLAASIRQATLRARLLIVRTLSTPQTTIRTIEQ